MWISEFEASLVYKASSRTARATQRNPVSKNPQQSLERTPPNTTGGLEAAQWYNNPQNHQRYHHHFNYF